MKTSYRVAWHAAILLACFAITSIWGSSGVAASPPTEAGIPSSLASFVKANDSRDTASVTECFSKDAVVYDDGRIMRGTDEIRQWIAELFRKFQYVVAPSNVRELTNGAILTATITGNFPGASVSLDYVQQSVRQFRSGAATKTAARVTPSQSRCETVVGGRTDPDFKYGRN